jgi:porphobilinogen synthase
VRENALSVDDLIQPLFVIDGKAPAQDIGSMPGQQRLNIEDLCRECATLHELGVGAVALFPSLENSLKSPDGAEALNEQTLVLRAVRAVKKAVPEIQILTDIALDPYTTHGHDGVLNKDQTDVDNDRTVEILSRMAVLNAEAGADFVAPSDMMDGRIGAIRIQLDEAGLSGCGIVAYSAKYNSAYYGPFRDAVVSAKAAGTKLLSKASYQLDPANVRQAERELFLDEAEGADILMVKPAGPYLDIIRLARESTPLPVAAYQVSGEYAQIHAAAKLGWLDLNRCRDESLLAIKRAGADLILTYFARSWAEDQSRHV